MYEGKHYLGTRNYRLMQRVKPPVVKDRQDKSSEELSQIRTRIEKIEKMLSEVK